MSLVIGASNHSSLPYRVTNAIVHKLNQTYESINSPTRNYQNIGWKHPNKLNHLHCLIPFSKYVQIAY